jgi:endogenous inhibitor of DNA gyrase (YacG/DUF329 family)
VAEVRTLSPRRKRGCPICGRPVEAAYAPFCSRRCADADLARWIQGGYRVETEEAPDADDRGPPTDGPPQTSDAPPGAEKDR